jgi:hypothetical protein
MAEVCMWTGFFCNKTLTASIKERDILFRFLGNTAKMLSNVDSVHNKIAKSYNRTRNTTVFMLFIIIENLMITKKF